MTPQQLKDRQTAYKLVFGSPAGLEVLRDLFEFCRANSSTFNESSRVSDALVGRREVWLRITEHMGLSFDELLNLYTGVKMDDLLKRNGENDA